jgi:hypothetical protein
MPELPPSRTLKYTEKARAMGVDVENPTTMHHLIKALQYCEVRFQMPKNDRAKIAEALGCTLEEISFYIHPKVLGVATRLVSEVFAEEVLEGDSRQQLLQHFHESYLTMFDNMMNIAMGKVADGGKRPIYRDQIAAFQALQNTKIREVYERALFVPEQGETAESLYIKAQYQLHSQDDVLELDETVTVS